MTTYYSSASASSAIASQGTTTTTKAKQKADQKAATNRIWELDTWRGVAICTMILYHFMWDLWFFRLLPPDVTLFDGFWKYVQRFTAVSFLLLVGISLTISYRSSLLRKGGDSSGLFAKFARRGLKVFGLGMIVTLVTWVVGVGTIHFGILHLIGFSIIAAYPFLRFRWLNFFLWMLFFAAGYFTVVNPIYLDHNWLTWLGLRRPDYYASDYFPVIPWFGVVLLGIFLGNTFYTASGRTFYLPDWGNFAPFRFLQLLGRNSLLIYMIHQPILYALAFLLSIGRFWWLGSGI